MSAAAKAKTSSVHVEVARNIPDIMEAFALRALVYMGEQRCPYEEEYDGNDFASATHLIARVEREPVGTMRLRWFAQFCKVERVAVRRERRGGEVVAKMIEVACQLAARKGYRIILGHIQVHLAPFWKRYGGVTIRSDRPKFHFSDNEYVEVMRTLEPHADAIGLNSPAMVMLRPEGAWDEPGVLDRSLQRHVPSAL